MMPLVACIRVNFDPQSDIQYTAICPALVTYPAEFQKLAADELDAIRQDNPKLNIMMNDYVKLRRACRKLAG